MAKRTGKDQGGPAAFDAVAEAIRQHGDALRGVDGVVAVRPGYRFQGGWITDQPAVVAVLPDELDAARGRIPPAYGPVPVDVTPASPAGMVPVPWDALDED